MNRLVVGVGVLLLLLGAGSASAWEVNGHVTCQASGHPVAGDTVRVTANDNSFTGMAVTDSSGFFQIQLPTTPNCFETDLVLAASCDTFVTPSGGGFDFCTTDSTFDFTQDFVISGCACATSAIPELNGHVFCQGTNQPLPNVSIQVTSTDGGTFNVTVVTDASGFFRVELPAPPGCFEADILLASCDTAVSPSGGGFDFCTTDSTLLFTQDFVVSGCSCTAPPPPTTGTCWLTGGGQCERGDELFSYGGNVNPGCSPTAGQGGQWTTTDMLTRLHFEGIAIEVVRCGNVEGITPGSRSPATPFNFIEFRGTGRVFGVHGNKAKFPSVFFFGRAEDRHEPGSHGQRDAQLKDRLYLNVFTNESDPAGSSIMLIDQDDDPATIDPIPVLHGNLQIHDSGCDTTAGSPAATTKKPGTGRMGPGSGAEASLAAPAPNPASTGVMLGYTLPAEASLSLSIYDVTGRLVRRLATGAYASGQYSVAWDLLDRNGEPVRNGVFFARLTVGGRTYTRVVSVAR